MTAGGDRAPGAGDPTCPHLERDDHRVCRRCGHCLHDVILNGACLYCGATDIDPIAISPKPAALIPAARLTRKPDPR
jgi:hypothetical protein